MMYKAVVLLYLVGGSPEDGFSLADVYGPYPTNVECMERGEELLEMATIVIGSPFIYKIQCLKVEEL